MQPSVNHRGVTDAKSNHAGRRLGGSVHCRLRVGRIGAGRSSTMPNGKRPAFLHLRGEQRRERLGRPAQAGPHALEDSQARHGRAYGIHELHQYRAALLNIWRPRVRQPASCGWHTVVKARSRPSELPPSSRDGKTSWRRSHRHGRKCPLPDLVNYTPQCRHFALFWQGLV